LHLAGGIGSDDRCNALISDGEDDFGEEAANFDLYDLSDELIASADLAKTFSRLLRLRCGLKEGSERASRYKVMTAGRFHARQLARENPLFDRRVAKAEFGRCFAGLEERVGRRNGVTSLELPE